MSLLLCYDGYIFKLNGKYYFSEIDDILLKRYLRIFDKIVLALRTTEVEKLEPFYSVPICDNRIEICELPMFKGPIEYLNVFLKVRKIIINASNKTEAGIFRLPSTVGNVACTHFRKSHKPYLIEVVANPKETGNTIKNIFICALMKIIDYDLKANCIEAMGVSYVTKINLPNLYPGGKNTIIEYYSSVELSADYYYNKRKFRNNNIFYIVHVANNIIPSDTKGNVTALYVVKELVKDGHNVNITFVGERKFPNLFDDIASILGITENVKYVGRKTKEELREILINSDLLLFPSRSEGLPRTVIEANALGLPCVASNVGGISELIDDEFLFDVDDYVGMSKKISQILTNKNLYESISKNNFEQSKKYKNSNLNLKRDRFYSLLLKK